MNDLIGTWRLVDWSFSVDAGRETRPWGGVAVGLLTYTEDGRMWAALMRPDRVASPTETLSGAPADVRASAAAGYLTYAGRYSIRDQEVIHHVEVSLLPNWVGIDEVRIASWLENGDGTRDLVLSTHPTTTGAGRTTVNRLRWRKIDPVVES